MGLDDRLGYLLLGCAIGFAFGYIARSLQSIEKKVDEVENVIKNENGLMRVPILANIALLLVLVMTVFASFASQKASNDVKSTQEDLANLSICNQEYLTKTIEALNERTAFTTQQASANVELQKSQSKFLGLLLVEPSPTNDEVEKALSDYFDDLTNFVSVSGQTEAKTDKYPYPTTDELVQCIEEKE